MKCITECDGTYRLTKLVQRVVWLLLLLSLLLSFTEVVWPIPLHLSA